MPPSALREMVAAVPDHMIRDIAMRDGRAPTGPSSAGVVPSSQQLTGIRPGGGSGWAREILTTANRKQKGSWNSAIDPRLSVVRVERAF